MSQVTVETAALAEPVEENDVVAGTAPPPPRRSRLRIWQSVSATVLALLLVWSALVAPDDPALLTPVALLRLPIEAVVLAAAVLVLPRRAGRVVAGAAGIVLGVLTILRLADLGFRTALDRPFDPIGDWGFVGPGIGLLRDSVGGPGSVGVLVGAGLVILGVLLLVPLSMLRLARLGRASARRRPVALGSLGVLASIWVVCAGVGAAVTPGVPFASSGAVGLWVDHVRQFRAGLADQRIFAAAAASADVVTATPGDHLLNALRGKDVLVVFVESYGRVAVQGSDFSGQVDDVLTRGTRDLATVGFHARSAFLTSPTFGGISWLAHSTLQSGLWVGDQGRYNQITTSNRATLTSAFKRAGWRTVSDVPSDRVPWPAATSFYHYDKAYDAGNVGYTGPSFSYASMPDQFTMAALHRAELGPGHAPVMAEIDLVSSHTPWAPLPKLISWDNAGDGSAYAVMPAQGHSPDAVWQDGALVRAAYGESIRYSLQTLISYVQHFGDDNLVMLVLGDHQPATVVTGQGAGHDVPVSLIARDSAVLARVSGWGWQGGLLPGPSAPVWPMDAFRDRFITAFAR